MRSIARKWDCPFRLTLIACGLCLGVVVFMELGRRIGLRRLAEDRDGARTGVGAVEGAVFGLMGLLLAFSFSGAAARFDTRRQLVVSETNAIGTAYLRLELLDPRRRAEMQDMFRRYVDARLDAYSKLPDEQAVLAGLAAAADIQDDIWAAAVRATREEGYQPAAMLLLPALNEMIDITTTRTMAARTHPPSIIFVMLGVLLLTCSLLAGVAMAGGKRRSWVHIVGFAAISAVTMYVILDLEYPRLGLIRMASFDQALVELRETMESPLTGEPAARPVPGDSE
ncbi:MAG: DUF4239 domain-containing protein [Planctomycetota bacterium]